MWQYHIIKNQEFISQTQLKLFEEKSISICYHTFNGHMPAHYLLFQEHSAKQVLSFHSRVYTLVEIDTQCQTVVSPVKEIK